MNTDNGNMFFYELKTAFCAFLPNNVTPKSVPSMVNARDDGTISKKPSLETCCVENCLKTAVFTIKDRKYCAIHAPEHMDEDKDEEFELANRMSVHGKNNNTPFGFSSFPSAAFPAAVSLNLRVGSDPSEDNSSTHSSRSTSFKSPTMESSKPTKTPQAPPSFKSPPRPPPVVWTKLYSEEHKKYYYWCEDDDKVTWKKPDDYVDE
jgi:hypothetical protein